MATAAPYRMPDDLNAIASPIPLEPRGDHPVSSYYRASTWFLSVGQNKDCDQRRGETRGPAAPYVGTWRSLWPRNVRA